ncbi:hypothetical protein V6N13_087608 [Hibiscus sabdariffa]
MQSQTHSKCSTCVPKLLHHRNSFTIWKGLNIVWNDVRSNVIWNIDNGLEVNFWSDPWIPDLGPLWEFVSLGDAHSLQHSTVADMLMLQGLGGWEVDDGCDDLNADDVADLFFKTAVWRKRH